MISGGRSPSDALMAAPICVSGSMIRRMGRRLRDSSPIISLRNSYPATTPASMRIVDPLLPQSSATVGAVRLPPRPSISIFDRLRVTSAPRFSTQLRVLAQSAALEKLSRRVVPSAIAPSIAYRCEMDLSPGKRTLPRTLAAGKICRFNSAVIQSRLNSSV